MMAFLRRVVGVLAVSVLVLAVSPSGTIVYAKGWDLYFPKGELSIHTESGLTHHFAVEVATSPDQLRQGLMYREHMPSQAGMLFDFGRMREISMWMRNTLIPLDMVFIDNAGQVVAVAEHTIPQSLTVVSPGQPAQLVLELNAGTAARLGIGPGARISGLKLVDPVTVGD